MSSALRSAVVFALVSAFAVLTVPGCSQQGEGERCDSTKNGDEDCDSGLTCVAQNQLIENITDRCCPAEGTETDRRCNRGAPTVSPTAGTSSGGTQSGGTSSGGTQSGGTSSGGTQSGGGSESSGGTESGGAAGATGAESTGGGDTAGAGGAG